MYLGAWINGEQDIVTTRSYDIPPVLTLTAVVTGVRGATHMVVKRALQ